MRPSRCPSIFVLANNQQEIIEKVEAVIQALEAEGGAAADEE